MLGHDVQRVTKPLVGLDQSGGRLSTVKPIHYADLQPDGLHGTSGLPALDTECSSHAPTYSGKQALHA